MWFSGSAASCVSQGTFLLAQDIAGSFPTCLPTFMPFKKDVSFHPKGACLKTRVHFNELN